MAEQQDHPNLKVFKQYGFIYQGTSGNQVIGRCAFCGANKKFFIQPEKKTWDCKICGKAGGYQKFLAQMVEECRKNFNGPAADKLIASRGIDEKTFKEFGVGYNGMNDTYLIPVWDQDKKELYNVRIYEAKTGILKNTAGSKASMFGLPYTAKAYKVVWLCEGEWDAMVMHEILIKNNLKDTIVLAVPGANTFKGQWTGLFNKKIVHVVYDNDHDKIDNKGIFRPGAGKLGSKKVYENLKGITSSLEFTNWPESYKDGFDLNDLYKLRRSNPVKTLKNLVALSKDRPQPIIRQDGTEDYIEGEAPAIVFDGTGLPPGEVYKRFTNWLELRSTDALDVLFGTVIANRLASNPVWMFFVGSSGTAKTELVQSLDECPEVVHLSSLTPNTLISGSGAGGSDPSLVPKLDGKVFTVKDFTMLMQMPEQAQAAIISQFRDAYDGTCAKGYGTGVIRYYKSKFGFISAVTHAIEQLLEGGTALGERFLSFKMEERHSFNDVLPVLEKVWEHAITGSNDTMRSELKAVAEEVLNFDFGNRIGIPSFVKDKTMAMAYWVSRMRGTITRSSTYKKEVTHRPYVELPTRLVSQFASLLMGIGLFRQCPEVGLEELKIIKHIGLSSVPYHLDKITKSMWDEQIITRANAEFTTEDLCDLIGMPYDTTYRFVENLEQLKLVTKKKTKLDSVRWGLSKDAKHIIELGEIYPSTTYRRRIK